MEIVKLTEKNRKEVLQKMYDALTRDELVVFPSDTVYGLAVNAVSKKAVDKLLAFKDRPKGKAISIAIASLEKLSTYAAIDDNQRQLIETLLPGPFTLVLSSLHMVDNRLEAEDNTIGIRIPDNKLVHDITTKLPFPITATSANMSGKGPHYSINAFLNTLSHIKRNQLSLIIDAGTLPHNEPSTVLHMAKDTLKILRSGTLALKKHSTFQSKSVSETMKMAHTLVSKYQQYAENKPLLFILKGDLGTGKTIFAKGVGAFLGLTEVVASPTYVVCHEYDTPNPYYKKFYHFDLYNIRTEEELQALSIPNTITQNSITLVEWGERLGSLIPLVEKTTKTILIAFTDMGKDERQLDIFEVQ
ncbi:MAG: L-threonylcarbamoyladenylate synthase [Candidatus Roizmanbacteria bacterium]|nr:L-threonylcarbamoyladenylate synthase [Candidatus Roizmanbacteria bacterium]